MNSPPMCPHHVSYYHTMQPCSCALLRPLLTRPGLRMFTCIDPMPPARPMCNPPQEDLQTWSDDRQEATSAKPYSMPLLGARPRALNKGSFMLGMRSVGHYAKEPPQDLMLVKEEDADAAVDDLLSTFGSSFCTSGSGDMFKVRE